MDFFFNTLKKILTLTVSIVFALVVLYVPQQYGSHKTVPTVEAFPVVEVGPNVVTNTIRTVKETVLDRIGWMLAKAVVSNIMASTIDWVNSGFRGSPAFVQDLDRFLLNVADEAAGRVLEEFGGEFSFICSPFRLDIQVALALQYQQAREGLPYQGCLLSEAFENFEDFVAGDFLQGGWQDWMQISANPNMYSQYGAYLEAQTTFEARIRNAEGRESQLLDFGKGFLSSKQCETVTGPDGEGGHAVHRLLLGLAGLLDLSLGHDHGDVSDHDRRPPSPQRARRAPYPVARRRQVQPHANPKARSTGCRSDKQ